MRHAGENADILRALGQFLDEQDATTFEIVNHHSFVAVSWDSESSAGVHQAYQEHQLEDLRREARELRASDGGPLGSIVELLRTIGQELDGAGIELSGIVRDARYFRVSGAVDGRYVTKRYQTKELVAMGAARRAARGSFVPHQPVEPASPDAFAGVEVGAVVLSEEREMLGIVKEIRGRSFKIAASGSREDYWLPAESVAAIGSAGEVILAEIDRG
ncbi:MAG TPA: hypothetical protein VFC51_03045 [Chloroflexota bacterium]|nr:hypothetical protein [Chloroflexota bacterium]